MISLIQLKEHINPNYKRQLDCESETRTKCRRIGTESEAIKKIFCYSFLLPENCDFYGVLHAVHDAALFAAISTQHFLLLRVSFTTIKLSLLTEFREDFFLARLNN